MSYVPQVTSTVDGIVDNLRRSVPALKDIPSWRIDMAHRNWSVSEDFGDEPALEQWLPEDSDENKIKYLDIQKSDLFRTVKELERYVAQLNKTIRQKDEEIQELRSGQTQ